MLEPIAEDMGELREVLERGRAVAADPDVQARTEAWISQHERKQRAEQVRIAQTIIRKALDGTYGGAVLDAAKDMLGPAMGAALSDEATIRAAESINIRRRQVRDGDI